MLLLNHHRRPCHLFSYIIAIIFLVDYALAEYDCSAKDDGWYYDPEFCHIYWRCIHGTAEEFECASGTAWDHHANRCNWLDSIDCTRSEKTTAKSISNGDSGDGQYLTNGNSDTVGGNNDSDDIDNQPPTAVKRKKKKTKKNRKLDSNKRMLDNKKTNGKDHLNLLFLSSIHSSSDFLCAGRDGFFAHPEYCTRYYRCSHGMDEVFECPRGTAWDDLSKSCAWVDQVNCDQKILGYSTSTPGEDTTTLKKIVDVGIDLSGSNAISSVSGTNGKDGGGSTPTVECQPTGIYSLPDPNDCSSYYQCDKGVQTKLNCTDERFFDISKRECNDLERVFCGARPINIAQKNPCVNRRDGFHPDTERHCHYYYQCVEQKKVREMRCLGDQKFSIYASRCGPASNAPVACRSSIPGNTGIQNRGHFGLYIQAILLMIIFMKY